MRRGMLAATLALACAAWASGEQTQAASQEKAPPQTSQQSETDKAVEEFKALTRSLGLREDSPRRRGANGGGRPQWHGRLYDNFRNDFLDAIPHEIKQRGSEKSTLRRNQFGFNVAGPVIIPRLYDGRRTTFFSVTYEGVRERVSRSYLRTVPTLPERVGDWSQTVDQAGNPLPIYDPGTTRPNPDFNPSQPVSVDNLQYLRDPFPGNQIPQERIDPVARKALEYYPAPNTAVGPFFRNNFFVQSPEENIANGMIAKLDHNLRDRHRLTVGLSFSNGFLGTAKWFGNPADPAAPDRNFSNSRASFEHVLTLSAKTLNTFSVETSTNSSKTGREDAADYSELIGLRGPGGGSFPVFYLGGYVSMGQPYPKSRNAHATYSASDSFSTRIGKHNLRFSGTFTKYQVNTFWPAYPSGSFNFTAGLTSLPGIVNTGHGFASFLLGLSDYSTLGITESPSYFRRNSGQLAFRHSWEAGRGLTINWGANLDISTPRIEKYNRQSTVDLNAINPANGRKGAIIVAGYNGTPRAFQPTRARIEPNIGLSWNPGGDSKSVLRASYSRSYSAIPIYDGQWGTQAFNGTVNFYSPNAQLAPAVTLSEGVPPLPKAFPDLRPDAANDTVADLMDRTSAQPMYQSASLSVEREMPGSTVVTLSLGHATGRNLLVWNSVNPNAIPLQALEFRDELNNEAFNRSLRPYPQYLGFDLNGLWPAGKYQRDAASLRIEKRATQGLTVSGLYEFSKQMDDYSGPYGAQDFFNRRNEWSLTPYNNPHRISLTAVYELPIGPNKPLFNYSDWRRILVEGWSVSQASSFYSGEPLALRPQFNNTGGVISALRVNVVPGVDPHVPDPGPELWFNPAAFDQPADFTMGNGPRTHPTLRSPISQNHDLSLTKRFALSTDRSVEFSAVGLNFLNHANWSEPDTVIGPASAPNVNAGKIIGSRGGRVIQLGLRFSF